VVAPERYVTDSSPNTLRKILRSWPLAEQQAFFERELRMPLELEAETGKLFPSSQRARDVRDGLVARVREAGARIWFEARVVGLAPEEGGWRVEFDGAPPARARAVIVATGGLSVPATGSDGRGLALVESLGHRVTPTYPALTPLTADPHPHASLAGVSARVTLSAPSARPAFEATDALLVTHRGWSGPAVLDASHVAIRGAPGGGRQEILVRWTDLDERVWDERLTGGSGTVRSAVGTVLAKRLVDELLRGAGVEPDTRLAQLKRTDRAAVARALGAYPLPWTGDEGYKKAEVTGGGVHLAEVDPRTMESRRRPGLYLCGEILDAFGPIGGHNFLWAFATGRAAGAAV
jgi:predicted Rossmann fold flavoprotein